MNAKTLFLRKEPGKQSLAEWWASICHDERFEVVMVYARAVTMEMRPTQPQIEGAELMLATLLTLPDNEEGYSAFPSPGLVHDLPSKKIPMPSTAQPPKPKA